jgi:hypothetical protein
VFEIPLPAKTSSGTRRPQYISAAVQSIKITLNTVNGNAAPSGITPLVASVTSTSNDCGVDSAYPGNYKCTVRNSLPPGSDALTIQTFDVINAGGHVISQQNYTANIIAGQSSSFSSITLDAAPGAITVTMPGAGVSGSQPGVPTFSATPGNASVASVSVSGSTLTITPGSTFNTPAQITNLTPDVVKRPHTTVLRSNRSNLATTGVAPERFACATAFRNSGQLSRTLFRGCFDFTIGADDFAAVPLRER